MADALSRLAMDSPDDPGEEDVAQLAAYCMCSLTRDESYDVPDGTNLEQMANLTLGKDAKDLEIEKFPMHPKLIHREQQKDKTLQKNKNKPGYKTTTVEDTPLITLEGKIVIPASLQGRIIAWYHTYLCHPGDTRMEATIRSIYTWPGMRRHIHQHVGRCRECQLCKGNPKNYGHLPAKQAEKSEPWNRVNVDLIGPLSVKTPKGEKFLHALTIIDPATGWFEMKDISEPTSARVSAAMDDVWFCRYPRPQHIGYDGGSEFKHLFQEMIENYGLTKAPSTPYNPQSNGIIERVHQVLEDALRTFELEEQDLDESDPWTPFIAATCFAIRSTYHTTLGASPAQLVFQRDMILPIKFKTDWAQIQQRRQQEINRNNARENKKRIDYQYKVGDKVSKRKPGIIPKLRRKRDGPYEVIAVYNNGTVRIRRGAVSQRLNIRRIYPFQE